MATRAQVRSQLASFLNTAIIDGLNQVFTSFPNRINFQVNAQAGQKTRSVVVIFIENETESRLALGGATNGIKRIDYSVVLQVFSHSVHQHAEDVMDDFDNLIDGIKARLRSDHRFGDPTGTLVWQGAEPEIDVSYGEPRKIDGNATEIWAGIRFTVSQVFNA